MAFPFIFEANFESGDNSEWDSEADTASQLDFPHYSELARFPWSTAAPYSGAYCGRWNLTGGTADATLTAGAMDIAASGTAYVRFNVWFSPNFDATADDTVHLFELQQTDATIEVVFGFRYVALTDVINFGIGETAPTNFTNFDIPKGIWHTIELALTVDSGGGNDGTIDLYVTRDNVKANSSVAATQVASLDQGAIGQGVLGVQNHLATTTGVILMDEFVMDDARVYPSERFPVNPIITKSRHVFVGSGAIQTAALLTTGGSDVLKLWDTDEAETVDLEQHVIDLDDAVQKSFSGPISFKRGCYAALSGTNPRAQIMFVSDDRSRDVQGPTILSPGRMRSHGIRRGV